MDTWAFTVQAQPMERNKTRRIRNNFISGQRVIAGKNKNREKGGFARTQAIGPHPRPTSSALPPLPEGEGAERRIQILIYL
jgi:hypothetical protein